MSPNRWIFCTSLLFALSGCGGEGSTGTGNVDSNEPENPGVATSAIGGGGTKGPLQNAAVEVFALDTSAADGRGASIDTGSTDGQARITGLEIPSDTAGLLLLVFTADADTTDLTTGAPPVISRLLTVVPASAIINQGRQVFATPLTTLVVSNALANAGTPAFGGDGQPPVNNAEFNNALNAAQARVRSMFGFGLLDGIDLLTTPPILIAGETDSADAQLSVARYRTALEGVGALAQQIANSIDNANGNAAGTTDIDTAFDAVVEDAEDGVIDGQSGNGAIGAYGTDGGAAAAGTINNTDPASLTIPNDPQNRTVADTRNIVADESGQTGNANAQSNNVATADTTTQPGNAQSDSDGDGTPDSADPDDDNDGTPDESDDQPLVGDAQPQDDTDGDGTPDAEDADDDNDGTPDDADAFPLDAAEDTDTDSDDIGDNADTDDDNDGTPDAEDAFPLDDDEDTDTDRDGIGNNADNDDDGDGTPDDADAFPQDPTDDADTDGDGTGNSADEDDDGDGTPDDADAFPLDPNEDTDTDRDGTGDNADSDDDNDGTPDGQDDFPLDGNDDTDTDGDGIGDNTDNDDDNDGTPDNADAFPLNPAEDTDTDSDGTGDNADNDDDNDGTEDGNDAFPADPAEDTDTDGDGIGNNADNDDDNDGAPDVQDAFPLNSDEDTDTDGDGVGNNADADDDGDGTSDDQDAFPLDAAEDIDSDGDGTGDNADTDDDNDGTPDDADAFPLDAEENADTDGDGTGDNADNDDDNDGTEDGNDAFPTDSAEDTDTDGDGIGNNADGDDDADGTPDAQDDFPLDGNEDTDTDGDGAGNNADNDDDGDGSPDDTDVFPLDPAEDTDTDGDGTGDNADADDDNDGTPDDADAFPNDPAEDTDTDGDGTGDNADNDDDNDGTEDGNDAFPNDPAEDADADGDGTGDNADADDDNDGTPDDADAFPNDPAEDTDTDGDGTGNNADNDDDGDGSPDDTDAFPLDPAEDTDSDGDGTGDNADADDDNDGVPDDADAFPNDPNEDTDTDGDGTGDNADTDDDNDGTPDDADAFPNDPNEDMDTDGDGTGNNADNDDDGDGASDDADAFPLDSTEDTDTDGDGTGNNADNDDDNDGTPDDADAFPNDPAEDADTDGDGTGNNADNDDDGDGTPDDQDAFPLDPAEDTDSDGDGTGNNADNDDDNDGINDDNDNAPLNAAPTIGNIPDQSTDEDQTAGPVAFNVDDRETDPADLNVTAASDNTTLLPNSNITLGGSGTNRSMSLMPAEGANGTATVTVTVDDGSDTASTAFTLTVNAVNDAPTITSGNSVSTPENQTDTGYVATANDPDAGDTVTFSLTGGDDQGGFSLDAAGALSFNNAPDFENPTDSNANNNYIVEITADDGNGGTDSQTVTVTVTDDPNENQAPAITSGGAANTLENNTATGYTATADDPNGDAVSFSLTGGDDPGAFSIAQNTGVLRFNTAPDFENPADANANNEYGVEITADDGNGGTDSQNVTVTVTDQSLLQSRVVYPPAGGNLGGKVDSTSVVGRLTDTEDGEVLVGDVASIDINGQSATQSMTTPQRWSGRAPVTRPDATLDVTVISRSGETVTSSQGLENQPTMARPQQIALDGNRAVVLDVGTAAIYAVELTDGTRSGVSDSPVGPGDGPALIAPDSMAVDAGSGLAFVTTNDFDNWALMSVDLSSGDRSLVSGRGQGAGPALNRLDGVAVDPANNRAFVATTSDSGSSGPNAEIYEVDLTSGDRTLVSSTQTLGGGQAIEEFDALAYADSDSAALLACGDDGSFNSYLLSIDLTNGDRTVISGPATGAGSDFNCVDVTPDSANNRALVTDTRDDQILAVDLASGNRTELTGPGVGAGQPLGFPTGFVLDVANNRGLVADRGTTRTPPRIVNVSLGTGDRQSLSMDRAGSGAAFGNLTSLAWDVAGARLLVTDSLNPSTLGGDFETRILGVSPDGGDRDIVTTRLTSNPDAFRDLGLFPPALNRALVLSQSRLFRQDFDPVGRSVISDCTGTDDFGMEFGLFDQPSEVVTHFPSNRGFVLNQTFNGEIVAVDLDSGDCSIHSNNNGAGDGIGFNGLNSFTLDADNDRLLAVGPGTVYAVDLTTGDRMDLSFDSVFDGTDAVTLDAANERLIGISDDRGTLSGRGNDFDSLSAFNLVDNSSRTISDRLDSGPEFLGPDAVAVDPKGDRAFVTDTLLDAVYVIDLLTGERAMLSR